MATIPHDPMMLLSYINTKLRDEYGSLNELCLDMELDMDTISSTLSSIDYTYDEKLNRFV
ncbi:MAG: DUF4250 domain-containing protein [Bacteroidales bacterium]|nr:DUF4250 domain-containing protein [Clostridium sp.]MCM1202518.1 DUF4250 domain-containing protein [Bacteroidales bacterium]